MDINNDLCEKQKKIEFTRKRLKTKKMGPQAENEAVQLTMLNEIEEEIGWINYFFFIIEKHNITLLSFISFNKCFRIFPVGEHQLFS